jgi:parallel beta-helix repeat protein
LSRRLPVLALVLVLVSSAILGYFIFGAPRHIQVQVKYPVAYHSPISIGSDSDFTKPGAGSGCECVRSGSGQELDPYLISDWILNSTDSDGVVIYGTTTHFVMARVVLNGASEERGVYFEKVENGIVEDCTITNWFFGVYTFLSNNLEFINNTVTGNQYGIQLEASNNNKLIGNRFDENRELGIFLRGSDSVLKNNSVTLNGFGGINVDGTLGPVNGNQLEGNIVSDNGVYGIGVWRASDNLLKSNTVTRNKVVGVMLTDHCTKNLIEANTISDNTGSGIALTDGSFENTIRGNIAKGNGDGVHDFDLYDNGSNNIWQNNTYDSKNPDSLS